MEFSFTISLTFILSYLMMASTTSAQSPQDFLDPHNSARAQVGVPPLAWDQTLADYARNYAQGQLGACNLVHSGGPYGENLAAGSGGFSASDAVGLWVNERSNYDYGSNSCVGGECRHYTQVVWRNSNRVGCARLQCPNGWFYVICSYDPRGNYIGERPY